MGKDIHTGVKLMRPKLLEISYQEAEKIIRSFGHSISRRKTLTGFVNTVTWSMPINDYETTVIKTELSNDEIKTIGNLIKRFNTDSVVFVSLASHIAKLLEKKRK
jgi:hypothetical protein